MSSQNHRAIVLSELSTPVQLKSVPTPSATPGSVIIKVLAAPVLPFIEKFFTGELPYPLKLPIVPGSLAVGRVTSEIGADAVSLKEGQLVLCDLLIRARDDPTSSILHAFHASFDRGSKLMEGEWRDGAWSEYMKMPLEHVYPLDEEALVTKQGYTIPELAFLGTILVPAGGLIELGLTAGETIIVAPATGKFSGAAVASALALGATVLAFGRNLDKLQVLRKIHGGSEEEGRLKFVQMTGDQEKDVAALRAAAPSGGDPNQGADAFIDLSPQGAAGSNHVGSGLLALRKGGRAAIMGGWLPATSIPYGTIMYHDLKLFGKYMYTREQALFTLKLAERGHLKLGKALGMEVVAFKLDEFQQAIRKAEEHPGYGSQTVLTP